MKLLTCPRHITALFLLASVLCSSAASTTGSETVNIGDIYTSNWRSTDFAGTTLRTWNAAADSFTFQWNTTAGDQIGRIGKSYSSKGFGVRIDDIRSDCIMSTTADARNVSINPSFFFWAIYGWTYSQNAGWPSPNGWNNEFYIVFRSLPSQSPTYASTSLGSVTVDGVVFDCYTNDMPWGTPNQTQWQAVARTPTWNASVNIAKVFAYWRSKGLPNEYVVDLAWAVEAGAGSSGELVLSKVNIPKPAASSHTAPAPASAGGARPIGLRFYSLTGKTLAAKTDLDHRRGSPVLIGRAGARTSLIFAGAR